MWIRSQDKETLVNATSIGLTVTVNKQVLVWGANREDYINIARYSSKERALKEIDNICEIFQKAQMNHFIYKMREEDER